MHGEISTWEKSRSAGSPEHALCCRMRSLVLAWDDLGRRYDEVSCARRQSRANKIITAELFDHTHAIMELAAETLGDLRAKYLVLHAVVTYRELPFVKSIVDDGECNWISLLGIDAERFGVRLGEFWMAGRQHELRFDDATLVLNRWMDFWRK